MLRTWARVCAVNSWRALGHITAKLKVLGKQAASGAEVIRRRVFPFLLLRQEGQTREFGALHSELACLIFEYGVWK